MRTDSTELGLLPTDCAIGQIQDAVRKLRILLAGWQVISIEHLLWAASRLGSAVRFRDDHGGSSNGITEALVAFEGFPWEHIPHGVTHFEVEKSRLRQGSEMLGILVDLVTALPGELIHVPGEAVASAVVLISTVRRHVRAWEETTQQHCECGVV